MYYVILSVLSGAVFFQDLDIFCACDSLRFFFDKARANTQHVLPVQTGLYRYDE